MERSFTTSYFHHAGNAWVDVNLAGEHPMLQVHAPEGTELLIAPFVLGDEALSAEHERFARELAGCAQFYADAIEGARFWADFDGPPTETDGVA